MDTEYYHNKDKGWGNSLFLFAVNYKNNYDKFKIFYDKFNYSP